ncbi:MAG: 16S rRNA (cytidine(1402)-2'-O)-methyltransferase [Lysobacterales bacterium]
MTGQLFVAATPIGNLSDVSERLREVLASADRVLAEDTRVSSRLLASLNVRVEMTSLHEHNEDRMAQQVQNWLAAGHQLVMISDAGTPLISDPGYRAVRAARQAGFSVVPVPGPSAITAALSVAGLATDRFTFHGFLSSRRAERQRQLAELGRRPETQVLFESSHRIGACIGEALDQLGADREAFIAREMTKRFEQYCHGTLGSLCERLANGEIPAKGEFVLIVAGNAQLSASEAQAAQVVSMLLEELPASQAARIAAKLTGLGRKHCYALAMAASQEKG